MSPLRLPASRAVFASFRCGTPAIASALVSRRTISVAPRCCDMYSSLKIPEADPMKIFDQMDTNGNGVISRDEFKQAVELMHYSDLLKLHEATKTNLEALSKKIEQIEKIEKGISGLKETYKKKKHAYENVGWMTAGDIDILFDDAARQKEDISCNVQDLKKLLLEAKKTLTL